MDHPSPPRISLALAGSAAAHGLFLGAVILLALSTPPLAPRPVAYTVTLVELPPPEEAPPAPAPPRPEPPAAPPRPAPPASLPRLALAPRPPAAALPDPFARALPTIVPPSASVASPTAAVTRPAATPTPSAEQLRRLALAGRESSVVTAQPRPTARAAISSPIRTDGPPFPYPHYLNLISDRISSQWFPPPAHGSAARAVLRFRILRDGSIGDLTIEASSGSDAVDRSALRAVLASSPLPPLPEGFGWESLGVHFGFDLSSR